MVFFPLNSRTHCPPALEYTSARPESRRNPARITNESGLDSGNLLVEETVDQNVPMISHGAIRQPGPMQATRNGGSGRWGNENARGRLPAGVYVC